MSKYNFIQLYQGNVVQFEVARKLWIPFIQEINSHDGKAQREDEILTGLAKRISIQGQRKDMHFELMYMDGVPVGIAMFAIDLGTVYGLLEKGYGTVMGFYIEPEQRRKGYGTEF